MTKQEIVALCENDERLSRFAYILFAEIVGRYEGELYCSNNQAGPLAHQGLWNCVRSKALEFEKMIAMDKIRKASAEREYCVEYRWQDETTFGSVHATKEDADFELKKFVKENPQAKTCQAKVIPWN